MLESSACPRMGSSFPWSTTSAAWTWTSLGLWKSRRHFCLFSGNPRGGWWTSAAWRVSRPFPTGRAVAFMRDVAHCILCGLNKKAGHAHAELGHDQSNYMFTVDLKTMKSLSPFKPFYIQAVTYLLTHLFINRNLGLLRIFTLTQSEQKILRTVNVSITGTLLSVLPELGILFCSL